MQHSGFPLLNDKKQLGVHWAGASGIIYTDNKHNGNDVGIKAVSPAKKAEQLIYHVSGWIEVEQK